MADLSTADEDVAFRRATERVRARIGFAAHVGVYLAIGLLLLVLNLVTTPESLWFFWPMLFWLIALAAHVAVLFGPGMRAIEGWRDREYEREIARMTTRRGGDGDDAGTTG